jgi:transcriptional regulator GlxA family with amidase domain
LNIVIIIRVFSTIKRDSMSAETPRALKILLTIHPKLDALDFVGPLEIFSHAHFPSPNRPSSDTKVFHCTITAVEALTTSTQGVTFSRDIGIPEAHRRLSEFDVMVLPGGGTPGVLESGSEPLALIRAFMALPKRKDGRFRTLLSVCTGSLFLASQGALKGLTAVTHPNFMGKLQEMCNEQGEGAECTKVIDERYVVNRVNQNGLRVVTSGGISCGLDASLWLVEQVAGQMAREQVGHRTQYAWRKGLVVDE